MSSVTSPNDLTISYVLYTYLNAPSLAAFKCVCKPPNCLFVKRFGQQAAFDTCFPSLLETACRLLRETQPPHCAESRALLWRDSHHRKGAPSLRPSTFLKANSDGCVCIYWRNCALPPDTGFLCVLSGITLGLWTLHWLLHMGLGMRTLADLRAEAIVPCKQAAIYIPTSKL